MIKKFLVSSANAYGYSTTDELLFIAKTLSDTSVEITTQNNEIRGGQGSPLQGIYFHSPDGTVTLTDVQFNLDFIALSVGSQINEGSTNMYTEETVTVTNGAGSVSGTPIALPSGNLYGWVTFPDGTVENVTFTTKAFTTSKSTYTGEVCVRYYAVDSGAREMTIPATIMPGQVKLVLDGVLGGTNTENADTSFRIGTAQMIFDTVQMMGGFTLSMTSDGVSNTPMTAKIIPSQSTSGSCAGGNGIMGRIIENIDGANWYDNVTALAIVGGDFEIVGSATHPLEIRAVRGNSAFKPPYADIEFTGTSDVTVTSAGVVSATASGTVTAKIKPSGQAALPIETTASVTYSAS